MLLLRAAELSLTGPAIQLDITAGSLKLGIEAKVDHSLEKKRTFLDLQLANKIIESSLDLRRPY